MVRIKWFEICHKNGFGGFENDVLPLLIGITYEAHTDNHTQQLLQALIRDNLKCLGRFSHTLRFNYNE